MKYICKKGWNNNFMNLYTESYTLRIQNFTSPTLSNSNTIRSERMYDATFRKILGKLKHELFDLFWDVELRSLLYLRKDSWRRPDCWGDHEAHVLGRERGPKPNLHCQGSNLSTTPCDWNATVGTSQLRIMNRQILVLAPKT